MSHLRVLFIDDSTDDVFLIARALERAFTFEHVHVSNAAEARAAFNGPPFDVILADYAMPDFGAEAALELVRELRLDVPFIIVSGSIGEDAAVAALKAGAHDFVLKDRLARLAPAIEREVREARRRDEKRRMERQLLLSERMASLGMLAAGVAHEVHNPFAVVTANLDYVLEELERNVNPPDKAPWLEEHVHEPLREAKTAAERMLAILGDLRLFSRSGDPDRLVPVDLRVVVESALRIARHETRRRATINVDVPALPPVIAPEGRLGQVFLNLIVNAAQAIEEGNVDGHQIEVRARAEGAFIAVDVRDTGRGIAAADLPHIFEPFFTTKPAGQGTGLGLSICQRIIQELGGQIDVESMVGRGTTFHLRLPIRTMTGSEAPRPLPVLSSVPEVALPRGRILVVDEDPLVATSIARMLGHHDVTKAVSGGEALGRIVGGERYDAILCELSMPQIGAEALHDALQDSAPDQADRMVVLCGTATSASGLAFLQRSLRPRLDKPFGARAVEQALRQVMR